MKHKIHSIISFLYTHTLNQDLYNIYTSSHLGITIVHINFALKIVAIFTLHLGTKLVDKYHISLYIKIGIGRIRICKGQSKGYINTLCRLDFKIAGLSIFSFAV